MIFSKEQKFIHHLLLQSSFIKDIGLLHGQMGIALFFYHYAKYTDNTIYSDYADELLDNIWENLHNRLPDTFESGLTGIAWGVEYLIQNNFVAGSSNEICEEIDSRIMQLNLHRITSEFIEKGLEGFLHYILIRTRGTIQQHSEPPFDERYRNDLFHLFSFLLQQKKINETCRLFIQDYLACVSGNNPLIYTPDLSLFIDDCKIEEDILHSPLGLKDGISGLLYKQIHSPAS
ncbi:hypothetical protein LJB92_00350 [Bacteroidales bacterium OttesenSCG-928-M06]|nr:hypothetical protein [Bacteroidales bacterium OttesenSCG-928-M06]